jgi:predicted DNA-binding transcriptional regulator AlpA
MKRSRSAISPELIKANAKHQAKQALTGDSNRRHVHDVEHVHAPRGPPGLRLLDKAEVCAIANVTYPTLWAWMRRGAFPRSRICGGKSMWRSDEVAAWLDALPRRPLKGDGDQPEAA